MRYVRKKYLFTILLSLTMSFFITSCSNSENNSPKVRIACFSNLTHAQAMIGMSGGQFQKALGENYEIEWKTFNAGPSEIEALIAGEVDIGYIGPVPAINGFVKSNGELQIIAGASDAGGILVSRKDLIIKDVKELENKKIAVPQFGNTQDLILRNILKENGLKDSIKGGNVQVIQLENADIKTLIDRGEIDAALVPEPWGSRLIKEAGANVVLDYNQVYRQGAYTSAVVVARTDFIEKHPDIIKEFLEAHVQLTDYINKNSDTCKTDINSQITKLTKSSIPDDILGNAFKRLIITNNPEKDSIVDFIKVSKEEGLIDKEPDIEKLLNLEILNNVLKENGQAEIQ